MKTILSGDLIEVRARAVEALKAQGFGILSEIDVQKTLKEKLGLEYEPYLILGACNPNLARQALDTDRDSEAMFSVTEEATRRQLESLAQEARARLSRALQTLEEAP
jgi:uncharacterized protein (DUF302 family)